MNGEAAHYVTEQRRKPHPIAAAMEWVAKITTVGLMMLLPAVVGAYLDQRLGTDYWAALGVVVGFVVGLWQLLQMTRSSGGKSQRSSDTKKASDGDSAAR